MTTMPASLKTTVILEPVAEKTKSKKRQMMSISTAEICSPYKEGAERAGAFRSKRNSRFDTVRSRLFDYESLLRSVHDS